MGSRLSPVLANTYMEEVENSVLQTIPVVPKMYVRFVDDIFIVFDASKIHLQELLEVFNCQHPDIKLTSEMEIDQRLPYLDILVKRNNVRGTRAGEQRSFSLSIHRKPTHSNKYLNFGSHHPLSLKRNTFHGLYLRNRRLLKNHQVGRRRETQYLLETFASRRNGYPRRQLNAWLTKFDRQIEENPELLNFRLKPRPTVLNNANFVEDRLEENGLKRRRYYWYLMYQVSAKN